MKNKLFFDLGEQDEKDSFAPGKDEMNFAEFPITLLTDRVPKGQRSIKFEDEVYCEKRKRLIPRRRIIEGSENYGLPTATDDTVVLALIQLTKQKSNFTRREVEFTRLELIKLLDWPDEGASYERLKKSLLRIKLVNYIYDNAWWDPRLKEWTTRAFSILDDVQINDSRTSHQQGGLFPSRFVWGEVVFDSFQAGFLRDIDFQLCMRLQHPIATRIYRFLGKRFYVRPEWVFDLKEFASIHLALGGKYEGGTQISRKLKPAIAELEAVGFLEPLPETERFTKKGRDWSVRFIQKRPPAPAALSDAAAESKAGQSSLEAELIRRGVSPKTATDLVKRHPAEAIRLKIEVMDWLLANKDKRVEKSPAGYLVKSINDDFTAPKNFVPKAEQQRKADAERQQQQTKDEQRRSQREGEAKQRATDAAVAEYRKSLSPDALAQLEADAIAEASEKMRQTLDDPVLKRIRDTQLFMLTNTHIAKLILAGGKPA